MGQFSISQRLGPRTVGISFYYAYTHIYLWHVWLSRARKHEHMSVSFARTKSVPRCPSIRGRVGAEVNRESSVVMDAVTWRSLLFERYEISYNLLEICIMNAKSSLHTISVRAQQEKIFCLYTVKNFLYKHIYIYINIYNYIRNMSTYTFLFCKIII